MKKNNKQAYLWFSDNDVFMIKILPRDSTEENEIVERLT